MNHLVKQTLHYYKPQTYFVTLTPASSKYDRFVQIDRFASPINRIQKNDEEFLCYHLKEIGDGLFENFQSECIGLKDPLDQEDHWFATPQELHEHLISGMTSRTKWKLEASIFSLKEDKIYAFNLKIRTTNLSSANKYRYQEMPCIPEKDKNDVLDFLNSRKRKHNQLEEEK